MLDALMRTLPLPAYWPLRRAVTSLGRSNPARVAATMVLKRAARAHRPVLHQRLHEIRPLDAPSLSFEAADSMVMDAVFWFGVKGYEGIVAEIWRTLCGQARSILEVGGNVGLFTVVGAGATTGRYTVIEPVPAIAATLRANLARNNLHAVEVRQAAVIPGSETRDVTLNLPEEGREMMVGAHLTQGVEVSGRSTRSQVVVQGLPLRDLAQGRDLIKIDAEGIEAALLADIRADLLACRPTLLVEVLPEAVKLGEELASLAAEAGYSIHVLPEYGSDTIVTVPPAVFNAQTPARHRSKDVVLSVQPLAQAK